MRCWTVSEVSHQHLKLTPARRSYSLQKPVEGEWNKRLLMVEFSYFSSSIWPLVQKHVFDFCYFQAFSASLAPLQRVVEDINDQASDFTSNNVALSRQILQRLEDINTRSAGFRMKLKYLILVRRWNWGLNWIIHKVPVRDFETFFTVVLNL